MFINFGKSYINAQEGITAMKPKLGLMLKEQRDFLLLIFAWKKAKDFLRLLSSKMTILPLDIELPLGDNYSCKYISVPVWKSLLPSVGYLWNL